MLDFLSLNREMSFGSGSQRGFSRSKWGWGGRNVGPQVSTVNPRKYYGGCWGFVRSLICGGVGLVDIWW